MNDHESYLIAGSAIISTITKGIGLEISTPPLTNYPEERLGEIAMIARHGLSLLSDAMMANSDTTKFYRMMTLLEFLAKPNEYRKWKEAKGDIACHIAKNKQNYHELLNRFMELTSNKKDNIQTGFRTLIVHHGKFIEDILPDQNERKKLFRELQGYIGKVLFDMLDNLSMSWEDFISFRREKKSQLGVN